MSLFKNDKKLLRFSNYVYHQCTAAGETNLRQIEGLHDLFDDILQVAVTNRHTVSETHSANAFAVFTDHRLYP